MTRNTLPKKLAASLRKMLEEGHSDRRIASLLGVSKSTVNEHRKRLGIARNINPALIIDAEKRRKQQEAARKEHVLAVRELSFRDHVSTLLADRIKSLPPAPVPPRVAKFTDAECVESMVLSLSDWHFAEIIRPDGVFGLNKYNRDIGIERAYRIANKTVAIKERLENGGWKFPLIVVCCNGDMVSGTIHEIENHTDASSIVDATLQCGQTLANTIRILAGKFERVQVFCTSGNHGRLPDARKVQTKEPSRSWDYLVYSHAKALLADCANVTIEIPDSWAVMFELEGKLFYQSHGHFVKSWNSIPFYGINRMTARLSATLSRHHKPVDYWMFGHFHTMGSIENAGGEYLINPSLVGPQDFGIHSMGEATPPGQLLFGVNRKYGITHRWRLAAEDKWPAQAGSFRVTKVESRRA